ncbi:DUF4256 domain-containing protein [Aegicerativicinus sediminis]|uniref:DUF4256 domain-containing protein n=1 Tax=Aegicerativicinus sediminis TaxID=2893202 RepID=UPI001E6455D1|nr:DUF4256 domain-containing protein [Aegicerativicinus sediminis]
MQQPQNLNPEKKIEFLNVLRSRFEKNKSRHEGINWYEIESKLEKRPEKLIILWGMEETGGEPDVVCFKEKLEGPVFVDCCKESPEGRRSLCYDKVAWNSRKKFKPENNAVDVAAKLGIELLDENQYYQLQEIGEFDTKTSSWLKTPESIRKLGGAIFGDYRFSRVFIYHNGAESYYAARGFRGFLVI